MSRCGGAIEQSWGWPRQEYQIDWTCPRRAREMTAAWVRIQKHPKAGHEISVRKTWLLTTCELQKGRTVGEVFPNSHTIRVSNLC